ncbi:MAG: hypothetical protein CBE00_09810 [Planctomycetaceae bacterium TMED240]|nr:hypothetical protein [Rhodopirellula sp.]OUX05683.1 MAG: hypothetical protein CBE00_09810 [Planctomycetaceae bacterium TMED240]
MTASTGFATSYQGNSVLLYPVGPRQRPDHDVARQFFTFCQVAQEVDNPLAGAFSSYSTAPDSDGRFDDTQIRSRRSKNLHLTGGLRLSPKGHFVSFRMLKGRGQRTTSTPQWNPATSECLAGRPRNRC